MFVQGLWVGGQGMVGAGECMFGVGRDGERLVFVFCWFFVVFLLLFFLLLFLLFLRYCATAYHAYILCTFISYYAYTTQIAHCFNGK